MGRVGRELRVRHVRVERGWGWRIGTRDFGSAGRAKGVGFSDFRRVMATVGLEGRVRGVGIKEF